MKFGHPQWLQSLLLFTTRVQRVFTRGGNSSGHTPSITSYDSINIFSFNVVNNPIAGTGDEMTIFKNANVFLERVLV